MGEALCVLQLKGLFCASVCSQGSSSQKGAPNERYIKDQAPKVLRTSTLRLSASLQLGVLNLP